MVTCTQTANERRKVVVVSDSNNVWKKPLKDAGLWRWWREQWDYLAKYDMNVFHEFAKIVYWQDDSLRSLKMKYVGWTVYNCTVLAGSPDCGGPEIQNKLYFRKHLRKHNISHDRTFQKTWHLKVQHVRTGRVSGQNKHDAAYHLSDS